FVLLFRSLPAPRSSLSPYTTLFRSCAEPCSLRPTAIGRPGPDISVLWNVRRAASSVLHLPHFPEPSRSRCDPYAARRRPLARREDRKSTRLNSSHEWISYAVFCLKK